MTHRQLLACSLAAALLYCLAPAASFAQRQAPPSRSLMVRLRSFLGLQPRLVSVGGTRSNTAQTVCLLAPGPMESGPTGAEVRVLDPQPRLVLGHPLNEIELRRGELVLWSQLASSKAPIRGPLPWPLPAMQAGDRLELALRPQGAAGGDWAVVTLEGASAEAQQRYASAVSATASSPEQRLLRIDQAAKSGDAPLAQALLWAPLMTGGGSLEALQTELRSLCTTPPTSRSLR